MCFPHAPYFVIVLQKAFLKDGICCCTDRITTAWEERDRLHAAEWAYVLVRSSKRNSERFPLGFRVQSGLYIIEHSVTDFFLASFGHPWTAESPADSAILVTANQNRQIWSRKNLLGNGMEHPGHGHSAGLGRSACLGNISGLMLMT